MRQLFARLTGWRLRYVLVLGFALTTAISIVVGTPITYGVINGYLEEAQDTRVGRDMDLARAFYNAKLDDVTAMAARLAANHATQSSLLKQGGADSQGDLDLALQIENEISSLPSSASRFTVVTDAHGSAIQGGVSRYGYLTEVTAQTDWAVLPIVANVLTEGQPQSATEVVPAPVLAQLGLEGQARVEFIDTPKAAPWPFDPREGLAGLVLLAVAPVRDPDGAVAGSVLVGHLFNKDFTLVDRVKEVAGVDTATIFFGDLRVSTNVLDQAGNRAIGTRVSQEVFDHVLVGSEVFTGLAYVVNQNYITRYEPLYNHLSQVVGMLYVGAKQSTFQRLLDSFRDQVYLIAAASILLAILIAIPLAWSISRPLTDLSEATRQVSEGDWSVRAPVTGYQEMRTLAETFNSMVVTLEEAQEQLVQKEKLASVGQLAAGVAHEINNPLGSVLLYADILRKETPEDDAQQRADLDMIVREATRCKIIVNDLLNFSRQNEILAQATDLNALIQELLQEATRQELFRDIRVTADLEPGLPLIQADPMQLRQVFFNLMTNAAEAMEDGGDLVLRSHVGPSTGLVTVKVQDSGPGIPEENMKKLFTPFFTTKPIGKGTGLGLAITYGIIKMHRGQITVTSAADEGSTFTVVLREELPPQLRPAASSDPVA